MTARILRWYSLYNAMGSGYHERERDGFPHYRIPSLPPFRANWFLAAWRSGDALLTLASLIFERCFIAAKTFATCACAQLGCKG